MTVNRTTSDRAFTLIEALLAIAVCAVVLVAINAVFFSALRLRAHVNESLDESLPLERAMSLLRRDLKNAVPPGGQLAGPLQSGGISGGMGIGLADNSGIQIYTTTGLLSADAPWGDLQKVTYQLQAPANPSTPGKDLVRSVTRNLLPTTTEASDDEWIASGIDTLQFQYFDGASWTETWDASTQTNLPQAVRVSISLTANAGAPHPQPLELLVPLVIQARTNAIATTGGQNGS
jgi:type II secretion system protein J